MSRFFLIDSQSGKNLEFNSVKTRLGSVRVGVNWIASKKKKILFLD